MGTRAPTDPRSDWLTRRSFARRVGWTGVGALGLVAGLPVHADQHAGGEAPAPRVPAALLERSPFVYVSPLKKDGGESTCHAELWYGWIDDAIVVTVARDRWKATALARGLDRARIWVGDHGRWKSWYGGTNEDFRKAPSFVARVERADDSALLERLLALYEKKYPEEIADWRKPMRDGAADGSRVLLRYTPVPT